MGVKTQVAAYALIWDDNDDRSRRDAEVCLAHLRGTTLGFQKDWDDRIARGLPAPRIRSMAESGQVDQLGVARLRRDFALLALAPHLGAILAALEAGPEILKPQSKEDAARAVREALEASKGVLPAGPEASEAVGAG